MIHVRGDHRLVRFVSALRKKLRWISALGFVLHPQYNSRLP